MTCACGRLTVTSAGPDLCPSCAEAFYVRLVRIGARMARDDRAEQSRAALGLVPKPGLVTYLDAYTIRQAIADGASMASQVRRYSVPIACIKSIVAGHGWKAAGRWWSDTVTAKESHDDYAGPVTDPNPVALQRAG